MDFTVRSTDCFQKIEGKWCIIHEHASAAAKSFRKVAA